MSQDENRNPRRSARGARSARGQNRQENQPAPDRIPLAERTQQLNEASQRYQEMIDSFNELPAPGPLPDKDAIDKSIDGIKESFNNLGVEVKKITNLSNQQAITNYTNVHNSFNAMKNYVVGLSTDLKDMEQRIIENIGARIAESNARIAETIRKERGYTAAMIRNSNAAIRNRNLAKGHQLWSLVSVDEDYGFNQPLPDPPLNTLAIESLGLEEVQNICKLLGSTDIPPRQLVGNDLLQWWIRCCKNLYGVGEMGPEAGL
ncbi:hypothetical protein EAF04_007890 [Stromatinia cepivora]|nr:hypothetical protein EAF04_007890 [Stromatinia cepivora]